jgi:hypothetical protein
MSDLLKARSDLRIMDYIRYKHNPSQAISSKVSMGWLNSDVIVPTKFFDNPIYSPTFSPGQRSERFQKCHNSSTALNPKYDRTSPSPVSRLNDSSSLSPKN